MKYVFGPVPSRRLGRSLGIDPVPLKTCNWNCVYCQLGRSQPLVNERREYFPSNEILAEVRQALALHQHGGIDWVTFVGSGETLLHSRLGWLIRQVKTITSIPVAVITNGSLLHLPEVRQDLMAADAVLPSLDAGSSVVYKTINRPHPQLTFECLVEGLLAFREEYRGKLWMEVMLLHGLNDTSQALSDIAQVVRRVGPDAVHINLPTRPPSESWIEPAHEERVREAVALLGSTSVVVRASGECLDLSGSDNFEEAVLGIITRHPLRREELEHAVAPCHLAEIGHVLASLQRSQRAQVVKRYGVEFWCAAQSHYPEGKQEKLHPQ